MTSAKSLWEFIIWNSSQTAASVILWNSTYKWFSFISDILKCFCSLPSSSSVRAKIQPSQQNAQKQKKAEGKDTWTVNMKTLWNTSAECTTHFSHQSSRSLYFYWEFSPNYDETRWKFNSNDVRTTLHPRCTTKLHSFSLQGSPVVVQMSMSRECQQWLFPVRASLSFVLSLPAGQTWIISGVCAGVSVIVVIILVIVGLMCCKKDNLDNFISKR